MQKILFLIRYFLKIYINKRIKSDGIIILSNNVKIIVEKKGSLTIKKNVVFKKNTTIYVKSYGKLFIGYGTSTGHDTEITCGKDIYIGDNILMGAYTYITDSNHSYDDVTKLIKNQPMNYKAVKLENNIWIGRNSIILQGVTVSENSIIAAGSVITKSFPPNNIIGGVPGKIIKNIYVE